MVEWLNLSEEERKNTISAVSYRTGLPEEAIEKDWWVTLTLKAVFSTPHNTSLLFKGGTSLSKAWGLIERFSEDIDLGLDRELLGFKGDLSPTQIKKLKKASCEFTSNQLKDAIENALQEMKVPKAAYNLMAAEVNDSDKDPQQLILSYKSLHAEIPYLKPQVLVEVSSRSLKEPWSNRPIQSFIGEAIPDAPFSDKPFDVPTVAAKRTFLEKAFLLHEEFLKEEKEKIKVHRMSRHCYDLERLMDSDHGIEALKDVGLYSAIVLHRSLYNKLNYVDYDGHAPQTINFVPPNEVIERFGSDYKDMGESMIYGQLLSFEDLMKRLQELQDRFRKIKLS